jgi:hypothetical protein
MAMGTVGITTDPIMAMGTVGITIVGGNPASALAAPSGSKMMQAVITSGWVRKLTHPRKAFGASHQAVAFGASSQGWPSCSSCLR